LRALGRRLWVVGLVAAVVASIAVFGGDAGSLTQAQVLSGAPGTVGKRGPQSGGLAFVMVEWLVAPEARSASPGPVTLVVTNRGSLVHGFEIKYEGDEDGRRSGSDGNGGSGEGDEREDEAETEYMVPGETVRFRFDLAAGTYEFECFVESHDDIGMKGTLRVG
jgi:uncharacterized cupredoxin-like copper-binding protein